MTLETIIYILIIIGMILNIFVYAVNGHFTYDNPQKDKHGPNSLWGSSVFWSIIVLAGIIVFTCIKHWNTIII